MIKLIKAIYKNKLFNKKFVNGVGIGYKIKDGEITDKKCIIVTVTEKKKKDFLKESDLVPKKLLGLFQTDVVEVGELKTMWRDKHRPVKMGSSCSWEGLTACSTGLPIWDRSGNPYLMMNGHCIWADGKAKVGDRVLQPAPADGGTKDDEIGRVTDMNYNISSADPDNIDLSIVKLNKEVAQEDVTGRKYIPETRYLTSRDLLKFIEGGGRTLETTRRGQVIAIDFEARVNGEDGVRHYKDCVMSLNSDEDGNPVVMGGDSSSIRFIDNKPLVQTFAGSPLVAIFNQTQKSLDYAEVEWGKEFKLQKPKEKTEGYVALGNWLDFRGDRIYTKPRPNRPRLRSTPEIADNTIKLMPGGSELELLECMGKNDGYFWFKVLTE